MSRADVSRLLREDLLAGVAILVAHAGAGSAREGSCAAAVEELCGGLGARIASCVLADGPAEQEEAAVERALEGVLAQMGDLDMLVVDAADLFAGLGAEPAPDAGERAMLIGCLQASWNITRGFVNRAFLQRTAQDTGTLKGPAGLKGPGTPKGTGERGGRIVYIAPAPDAGAHAEAARAGLENLARTLSIEWARYGITPLTIAPGTDTSAGEVAALTAYLASPAGAYFSGCLLDLRGPGAR
jgi:NAD(P)-dependent dehydrogenase (short-subunit alcohol dehydrogenase family)